MTAGPAGALGALLGAGREAEVYAGGADAVVKVYRPGYGGHGSEEAALAALNGHGIAPRLLDVVDCDGRPGLVLERLDGADMLTLLQHQPWRVRTLARTLAAAHLAVHGVPAPATLPDLREALAARIGGAILPLPLRQFALQVLDGLPAGDRLCHGDYHPGNLLVGADRVGVIDWPGAARGVPEADHARTLLLLRWADPVPGTSLMFRGLIATGRSVLAHAYAQAYARGAGRPLQRVDSWLVVHVAARVSEGIEGEVSMLTSWLDRAQRKTAL